MEETELALEVAAFGMINDGGKASCLLVLPEVSLLYNELELISRSMSGLISSL